MKMKMKMKTQIMKTQMIKTMRQILQKRKKIQKNKRIQILKIQILTMKRDLTVYRTKIVIMMKKKQLMTMGCTL